MQIARRIVIFAALWLLFEIVISLFATCDQVAHQASQRSGAEQAAKHCSALTGPVLASGWAFLYWLGHVLEGYGEAVIAVFTIVLAFATGLLWKATRDLVRGAEITAERQLRAYVFVEVITVESVEVGQRPKITAKIKNAGQTPAYNLRNSLKIAFERPGRKDFALTWGGEKASQANIGPSLPFTAEGYFTENSNSRVARMQSGEAVLLVWGEIRYTDAFGHDRYTRYRYILDEREGGLREGKLFACAEGNEAN